MLAPHKKKTSLHCTKKSNLGCENFNSWFLIHMIRPLSCCVKIVVKVWALYHLINWKPFRFPNQIEFIFLTKVNFRTFWKKESQLQRLKQCQELDDIQISRIDQLRCQKGRIRFLWPVKLTYFVDCPFGTRGSCLIIKIFFSTLISTWFLLF